MLHDYVEIASQELSPQSQGNGLLEIHDFIVDITNILNAQVI